MCIIDKTQIAHTVLAYLDEHQEAHDTLEGIVEWWLMEQKIVNQTAVVREALGELVAEGLLLERTSRDSQTHYCLNQQKSSEIRRRLGRTSP